VKAVAAGNPDLPQAEWRLAGLYIGARRPEPALELLLPLEERFPNQYEVIAGLGFANHLKGDYASAATHLERALAIRPPNTSLLNALADCHLRLGDPQKAKPFLERSLELNPGQERVKKQLNSIKESSNQK
jgi:Flp pilus assembly protein TadD